MSFPILGVIIPWITVRKIPLNRDLSVVDTGQFDMADETGPYYVRVLAFEWLGFGFIIWQYDDGQVRDSITHEFVDQKDVL